MVTTPFKKAVRTEVDRGWSRIEHLYPIMIAAAFGAGMIVHDLRDNHLSRRGTRAEYDDEERGEKNPTARGKYLPSAKPAVAFPQRLHSFAGRDCALHAEYYRVCEAAAGRASARTVDWDDPDRHP